MQAGKLGHRVKLQAPGPTQDGIGQPIPNTWTDVASLWADIRYVNGLETIKAGAPVSVAKCSIRIRFRAGVLPGYRLTEGTTYYDIKAILPDSTGKRYIDLACETGASPG